MDQVLEQVWREFTEISHSAKKTKTAKELPVGVPLVLDQAEICEDSKYGSATMRVQLLLEGSNDDDEDEEAVEEQVRKRFGDFDVADSLSRLHEKKQEALQRGIKQAAVTRDLSEWATENRFYLPKRMSNYVAEDDNLQKINQTKWLAVVLGPMGNSTSIVQVPLTKPAPKVAQKSKKASNDEQSAPKKKAKKKQETTVVVESDLEA